MPSAPRLRMAEQDYLAYDAAHEGKHQYVNGEVLAMAGASLAHNLVVGNLLRSLGNRLAGAPCYPLASDQRVRIAETGMYTYPDVAVVCGRAELDGARPRTLLNPAVLFEVLSESTESGDRGWKARHYRHREGLRAYVLVACPERRVEIYSRTDAGWALTEVEGDGVLPLAALGIELDLGEIYDRLDLVLEVEHAADEAAGE